MLDGNVLYSTRMWARPGRWPAMGPGVSISERPGRARA